MSFRAQGTSVVRSTGNGEDVGIALTFSDVMAQRIADALNSTATEDDAPSIEDPLTGKRVPELNVQDRTPLSQLLGDGSFVKIVGPYATAEMNTDGGRQIRSLAEGAVVPGDVSAGTARHLIDVGLAKLVKAASAAEVHEAAPTERHRVEAAAMTGHGPTVGQPAKGTVAYDYDQDPVAAAQAAAEGPGPATVTLLSGAGEAPLEDAEDLGSSSGESSDGKPRGNASEAAWRDYHVRQQVAAGVPEEDARAEADGLSRNDLRDRYAE